MVLALAMVVVLDFGFWILCCFVFWFLVFDAWFVVFGERMGFGFWFSVLFVFGWVGDF